MNAETMVVEGQEVRAPKLWTADEIRANMLKSDQWLYRGLKAIYARQTQAEQSVEGTLENNGVGFNGVDGHILSSFAKQAAYRGFLTPKQLAVARKAMPKYASQLAKIANRKI